METVPYILMQDRLSTGGSFILCDCNARGFPIRYASPGFCELFGYNAAECVGVKCGDLVAEPSIRGDNEALNKLRACLQASGVALSQALTYITSYAAQECRAMMASPTDVTGFVLVPNRHKGGQLKVIEVVMLVCRHPKYGWAYTVGLQTDVTQDVPLQKLFTAALDGTYPQLVKAQEPAMKKRLHLLDVGGQAANQYLDVKASEMWQALMLDLLGVEVKSLGEMSEFATTGEGTSAGPSESGLDSEPPSTSTKHAGVAGKLPRQQSSSAPESILADIPFKQQISEGSTVPPEQELQAFSRHGTDEVVVNHSLDDLPSLLRSRGVTGETVPQKWPKAVEPPSAAPLFSTWKETGASRRALLVGAVLVCVAAGSVLFWQRQARHRR